MKIRDKRCAAKITQDTLAKELEVDRTTITKWESGAAMPTADKLPKLARALGCSIDELFGDAPAGRESA